MSFCKVGVLFLAIMISLQACGAAPRPFRALTVADKYSNPLLEQRDGAGIHIHVADGNSVDGAKSLELALMSAFEHAHIPATTGDFLIKGHQLLGRRYSDGDRAVFRWTLSNNFGQGLGEGISVATGNLPEDEKTTVMARQTADDISILLKPENMQALEVIKTQASVAIVEVTGAPGDGDQVLPKAMRLMLQESNIPTTSDPALAILHVFGKVKLIGESGGGEKIHIDWIFRHPNGEELGSIAQENNITPGSLAYKWGDSAYDVAYAMVATISDALSAVKKQNAGLRN